MPLFSVIIPTFNREEMTIRAVDSVLAQDFRDFELIVVDDGSRDGTCRLPEIYGNKISYIRQDNSGVSSARNRGIRESSAPWVAFLDSDDTWHRKKLSFHKDFIGRSSLAGIHQTEDIWIRKGVRVNPGKRHIKQEGDIFIRSLELCMISPSAVVISREILDRYGLFDERLPACEDYDLWLRITAFEKTGLIREKLVTRYAGHEGQLSSSFWGMDRFRLYSTIKLLQSSGHMLTDDKLQAASESALKRAEILKQGAEKRGKPGPAAVLGKTITLLKDKNYRQIDCPSLLAE